MSRIVICGATGFIGRNLAEHFARTGRHEVIAIAHRRPRYELDGLQWIQADLRETKAVEEGVSGADIVIQAAATTSGAKDITSRPFIHVTDNAMMNSVLLRAAYEQSVQHFIYFSCTVMYPSSPIPVKEEGFTGEISPKYFGVGWTKVYIQKMCEFYARLGRTKHTVIRHSNIYGPRDKFDLERSHVFGATVTKTMLADREVTVWGTGDERRDLLHVEDLVRFVDLAIERQEAPFRIYNCGLGESVSVRDLVSQMVAVSGKPLRIAHDLSQPSIPFDLTLDCARARTELGWEPRIPLAEGIARTVRWWQDNVSGTLPAGTLSR